MSDEDADRLLAENLALNEQVKRLVRSEREVYMSQRALEVQLARLRHLNAFTYAATQEQDPSEILRLSLVLLMSLFPFEQGVAYWRTERGLCPIAVHAVRGMEESSDAKWQSSLPLLVRDIPRVPLLSGIDEDDVLAGPLLAATAELYEPRNGQPNRAPSASLVLPVGGTPEQPLEALLVTRRITGPLPYHNPLPTQADRDLLELAARQISVAISNAALVVDLKHSYERLAIAQAGLIEKERLAAVGELAAQMAHEVRNPLGAVYNSISRLRRIVPGEGEQLMLLDIMSEEASRLNRIVTDLLDFARPLQAVLVDDVVRPVVERAAEAVVRSVDGGLEFQIRESGPLPRAKFDERMLERSLTNLLLNASQAMDDKGSVEVLLRCSEGSPDSGYRIDVIDRGCGVPSDIAERIFEPFVTSRARGTGLGLALVKRYVDAQQAEISFESSPGAGSIFTILLRTADLEMSG